MFSMTLIINILHSFPPLYPPLTPGWLDVTKFNSVLMLPDFWVAPGCGLDNVAYAYRHCVQLTSVTPFPISSSFSTCDTLQGGLGRRPVFLGLRQVGGSINLSPACFAELMGWLLLLGPKLK